MCRGANMNHNAGMLKLNLTPGGAVYCGLVPQPTRPYYLRADLPETDRIETYADFSLADSTMIRRHNFTFPTLLCTNQESIK